MITTSTGFFIRDKASGWYFGYDGDRLIEPCIELLPGMEDPPPNYSFGMPELFGPGSTLEELRGKGESFSGFLIENLEFVPVTITIEYEIK